MEDQELRVMMSDFLGAFASSMAACAEEFRALAASWETVLSAEPVAADAAKAEAEERKAGKRAERDMVLELLSAYPHGWAEGGTVRKSTRKQVASALAVALRKATWEEILAGAQRQPRGIDQQYNPALHRWIQREGWTSEVETVAQPKTEGRGSADLDRAERDRAERDRHRQEVVRERESSGARPW